MTTHLLEPVTFDFDAIARTIVDRRKAVMAGAVGWGGWSFNQVAFVLTHVNGCEVDLLWCDSPAHITHQTMRMARKCGVFDPNDIGHFVQAVRDIGNFRTCDGRFGGWPLFRALSAKDVTHGLPSAMARKDGPLRGVYCIRSGDSVKIGRATDAWRRLDELQTGNPSRLELIAMLSLDPGRESFWHERFSHLRTGGEWFTLCEQVAVHLRDARGGSL